ncbi:glycoside hydrolase family 18 protein [Piloderma croceum F 1598]|uniref:Glycoside hydrolase family 18 protein n=1 Tax=Piloderma croceum (strain F 1598) TaxID=765440 RepID=A0A0C3FAV4_PILCF|nr:glycoside hydrolase family 18 protein [Piloderma croceum F 1598]
MLTPQRFSIDGHTTTSTPRPHILYNIQTTSTDGATRRISRRYSEFVALHQALDDKFSLPPKRLLVTTFIPSAWIDDTLISERRAGLTKYLNDILQSPQYEGNSALVGFLSQAVSTSAFDLEDALPSTLSRKAALDLVGQAAAVTPIAAAYYEDWATSPSVENIDFSKFDIIFFAFVTPSSSYELSWDSGAKTMLKKLVSAAHDSGHKTKIVLSVGGWGGCKYYSAAMSSSNHRTTFIDALSTAVNSYDLDGIDIDWEYPNSPGAGQPYSPSDSANLLLFFQSLRTKLGSSKIISAAVTQLPWLGSNGRPLTNVSAYAKEMNYVNIMNYDVNGASSNPGPNAPLGNPCGTNSQPSATAKAAFKQWTAAGFPAGKLLLGLPLYGYVSKSSKTTLSGGYKVPQLDMAVAEDETTKTSNEPHSRVKSSAEDIEVEATGSGDLSKWYGQQIPFNSLLASGALKKNSNGTYSGANGYTMKWDNCSDTPFLYNTARTTVVTYDDTHSLGDKAAYAKSSGMGGCFTWALDQDDGTTLQSVIRSKLGI